jgi:hypothetical protein
MDKWENWPSNLILPDVVKYSMRLDRRFLVEA